MWQITMLFSHRKKLRYLGVIKNERDIWGMRHCKVNNQYTWSCVCVTYKIAHFCASVAVALWSSQPHRPPDQRRSVPSRYTSISNRIFSSGSCNVHRVRTLAALRPRSLWRSYRPPIPAPSNRWWYLIGLLGACLSSAASALLIIFFGILRAEYDREDVGEISMPPPCLSINSSISIYCSSCRCLERISWILTVHAGDICRTLLNLR